MVTIDHNLFNTSYHVKLNEKNQQIENPRPKKSQGLRRLGRECGRGMDFFFFLF
jgi:hypothetical protein